HAAEGHDTMLSAAVVQEAVLSAAVVQEAVLSAAVVQEADAVLAAAVVQEAVLAAAMVQEAVLAAAVVQEALSSLEQLYVTMNTVLAYLHKCEDVAEVVSIVVDRWLVHYTRNNPNSSIRGRHRTRRIHDCVHVLEDIYTI
ncbi:hypothetical protein LSAT2_021224, partial [Lamellibrachia satsuma]